MKPRRFSCGGFTFVEILIALLLLGIAAVPVMQAFAVAVEQTGYADDLRTATDLAREEVEQVKNLAFTEEQIKQMGNRVSAPIPLNGRTWYTVRVVDPKATPLEMQVYVYRGKPAGLPVVRLATIVNK